MNGRNQARHFNPASANCSIQISPLQEPLHLQLDYIQLSISANHVFYHLRLPPKKDAEAPALHHRTLPPRGAVTEAPRLGKRRPGPRRTWPRRHGRPPGGGPFRAAKGAKRLRRLEDGSDVEKKTLRTQNSIWMMGGPRFGWVVI